MVKLSAFALLSISASLLCLEAVMVDAKSSHHHKPKPNPGACFLTVPKDPLSAKGLATPYILKKGNCDQTIANQQVFVEATVFDLDNHTFGVYHPLVINEGTKAGIAPVIPKLPKNAVVALWFGANANSVTLLATDKTSLRSCTNGLSSTDIFGQVAFCNAEYFFRKVHEADKAGKGVVIPPIGVDVHGKPCPTTRHFGIVDQDQSDNVITTYLQTSKYFAQNTAQNRKKWKKTEIISNGSDNALVAEFLDPVLKCTPFKAPSLMESNVLLGSMALNELHATRQLSPVALIPSDDPMVLSNGKLSIRKVNAYRKGVSQTLIHHLSQATAKSYCEDYGHVAPSYIQSIQKQLVKGPSPDTGAANNLLTFMGQRYAASWTNLGCDKVLKKTSDITVTTDKKGVAIKVHFHQSKPVKGK
ncbi:hypothetical protein BGZ83_011600 [Gryganskiella cystojenkinii]|nr:hypothetical protein BGZ83_011600 [Gryganskiella cystojenkinii]